MRITEDTSLIPMMLGTVRVFDGISCFCGFPHVQRGFPNFMAIY